jgi:hypothetical protein
LKRRADAYLTICTCHNELYVGTLRKFIEPMNGELVLAARFSDGVEIPIQLAEAEDAA